MRILKKSDNLNEIIAKEKEIIVQFGEKRCLPCQDIKEKILKWQENRSDIQYIYIPFEEFPKLAASYSVFVVPAVFVYIQGKLTLQASGYFGLDDILNKTENYLKMLQ